MASKDETSSWLKKVKIRRIIKPMARLTESIVPRHWVNPASTLPSTCMLPLKTWKSLFALTERMCEQIWTTRSCSGLERFGLSRNHGCEINIACLLCHQPECCIGKNQAVAKFDDQVVVWMKHRVLPVSDVRVIRC